MEDVRPESSTGNGADEEPRLTGGWPRRKPEDNSTSGSPIYWPADRSNVMDLIDLSVTKNIPRNLVCGNLYRTYYRTNRRS